MKEGVMPEENDLSPESEDRSPAPEPERQQPPRSEVPQEVRDALRRANREAETLRRQLKDYQDKDKSETERLAERAAEQERRAAAAESLLLRYEVGSAKGLPAQLVGRLQGDTREELEADAEQLLALVAPPKPAEPEKPAKPQATDLGQGRREGAPASSVAAGRERGKRDLEAQQSQQRDPWAGMRRLGGP